MSDESTQESQKPNGSPNPPFKGSGKTQQKSLCRIILIRAWMVTAIFLFATGMILLIFGAIYWKKNIGMFLGGALCLVLAVPVTAFYLWCTHCYGDSQKIPQHIESRQPSIEKEVSTVGSPGLYKQNFTEPKTDVPVEPLVTMTPIMSSPKSGENEQRLRDASTSREPGSNKSSVTSTPDILSRRFLLNKINFAPLASAETLTPSLRSSFASISTAI
ncbi:uncharacterized protein LOC111085850 isoform X3 [Limulus polyphemus]|uniref:Uncharacterized protein LOC111085850 isoform X2 n=1 Tax=Limulus polyphemus TaxID=6850 RepID=A0ABM1SEL0_LIMPO|nr:uncharacterized protein LOC111085850 isoform X2 [Limulus polyphemus]XP_022242065.1 uncharacterized protein LOC111085850 isoform X3 [Limulus polyphemus]